MEQPKFNSACAFFVFRTFLLVRRLFTPVRALVPTDLLRILSVAAPLLLRYLPFVALYILSVAPVRRLFGGKDLPKRRPNPSRPIA